MAEPSLQLEKGASFRDPAGRVLISQGRVLRVVTEAGRDCLEAGLASSAVQQLIEAGRFVRTDVLASGAGGTPGADSIEADLMRLPEAAVVVEHEAIPFPSYPYEWPPEMLWAAGALTLDLAEALLDEGLGLKDATPYNVLFRGHEPVFIDALSIERRDPHSSLWLPRAEFIRTVLLPLLVNARMGIGLEQTLGVRHGLEPETVYRWLTPAQRLLPRYLTLVSLPVWMGARHNPADSSIYAPKSEDSPEKAKYILQFALRSLRRQLNRLAPESNRQSSWSQYMTADCSYTSAQFSEKEAFVTEALQQFPPRRLLDIGCNTGHFSAIAARAGASVVAVDADPTVVGQTWQRARNERLDLLPLVGNLARPAPALGWRNSECPSFLERATGAFDGLLMLAVAHHLLATERVPLHELLELASELTTDIAIIEFVGPNDPMFRRISRGRDDLYQYLTPALFEQACRPYFEIIRSRRLTGSERWLYLLKRS